MKIQSKINQNGFKTEKGFINDYQKLIMQTVIPYQYRVLKGEEECGDAKSYAFENLINAARVLKEGGSFEFKGPIFQDSDLAKWLEAVGYALSLEKNSELERLADEAIDLVAASQSDDGYLDSCYVAVNKERRFENLREAHELYCSGHMIEAAVAYFYGTGKRKLLDVMLKNAEHIYKVFVVEGHEGYPGHPEIELALLRLYRASGNRHCLELAKHFIDVRGVNSDFFIEEGKKRDWMIWGSDFSDKDYSQSAKPVRDQSDAVGHSVRAVYLYTAMADLASETEDKELFEACKRLWESITQRRMYITGGIGSTSMGEAFTVDYDLPVDTIYAESCASIGLIFFGARMLENELNGEYADIMERAFYNTVLAGMGLDGKHFFYVNPLEAIDGVSETAATRRHVIIERPSWYACACCPPNIARMICEFGDYAYGENSGAVFAHMFVNGEARFENGAVIRCETEYPYGAKVKYTIEKGGKNFYIHIPGYSKGFKLTVDGKRVEKAPKKGYICLENLGCGAVVELEIDNSPKFIYPSEKLSSVSNCVAVERGPIVYCFEGVDNGDILSLSIDSQSEIGVEGAAELLPQNTNSLSVVAYRREKSDSLYSDKKPSYSKTSAKAIPYYLWANRGRSSMRVWMPLYR